MMDSLKGSSRIGLAAVLAVGALVLVLTRDSSGDDWPNWRGPHFDGTSEETGWTTDWPGGPKVAWRASVGQGWSSFAVAEGRAYTMGNADGTDSVFCFDAVTGKETWKKSYACPGGDHPGPRSTPTVEAKCVYTLSQQGDLCCFEAASGKPRWTRRISARAPQWGFASSPLIHGNLVIINTGMAGMAFNKTSGEPAWSTGNEPCGYASPVVYKSGSRTILLMFGAKALMGVSTGGRVGWSVPWETEYDVNAADPLIIGDRVFISSGYNVGCALLSLASGEPRQVWRNRNIRSHYASNVLWKDQIYGIDDSGLRCLDVKTGQTQWSEGSTGKGGVILVDGKLVIQGAGGELIVAEASPDAFKPLARGRVLSGTCWTPPTLANGRIYCRNSGGDLACVDVTGK